MTVLVLERSNAKSWWPGHSHLCLWGVMAVALIASVEATSSGVGHSSSLSKDLKSRRSLLRGESIIDASEMSVKNLAEITLDPPSLAEIEHNLTLYLKTLHSALGEHQGAKASPVAIWETYFDVTTRLPMQWDGQNRDRHPHPREDGSIFVSLGTYRGDLNSKIFLSYLVS